MSPAMNSPPQSDSGAVSASQRTNKTYDNTQRTKNSTQDTETGRSQEAEKEINPNQAITGGVGPHPSFIQVAQPFIFEPEIRTSLEKLARSFTSNDTDGILSSQGTIATPTSSAPGGSGRGRDGGSAESNTKGPAWSAFEAKEAQVRLLGIKWIDTIRKAAGLPIKTFNTACVYYHKFRLVHSDLDHSWQVRIG
jgi:hypothetical protein